MLKTMTSLALIFLCLPILATGAVIHVPSEQPTIQAGIDAAGTGDTVLVADGIYAGVGNRDLDFGGKAITVQSESGAENCIVDCELSGRGFVFFHGEGASSVLQGITIRNGYVGALEGEYGGGIRCYSSSSPTISECIITANEAVGRGGGIHCRESTPIIMNCTVSGNTAGTHGGGIYYDLDSSADITGCNIEGNTCGGNGGGIHFNASMSVDIKGCTIDGNHADSGTGGGIYCYWPILITIEQCSISDNTAMQSGGLFCHSCSLTMTDCTVNGNISGAFGDGGGIGCFEASPAMITGCRIAGNMSGRTGGGIFCYDSPAEISNCVFDRNEADGRGGGIDCYHYGSPTITNCIFTGNNAASGGAISGLVDSPSIVNCTIVGNTADDGGGFHLDDTSTTVTNSILWNNLPDQIFVLNGLSPTVTYSNIEGSWPGAGNIYSDPLFVAGPHGAYYLSQAASGQAVDSPCLDAGGSLASAVCFTTTSGATCLDELITRTDQVTDLGQVDQGYHYPFQTVLAELTCLPSSGTLPLNTSMTMSLANLYPGLRRRIAARIDVALAGGAIINNWKAGYTNIDPMSSFVTSWTTVIPDLATVVGENVFSLHAEDVTPAPYNQPPYPPAGDTAIGPCSVVGIEQPPKTIEVSLSCNPISGTLPFSSRICVAFTNTTNVVRRAAFRMDWTLADGTYDYGYRQGWNNIPPNETSYWCWNEYLPQDSSTDGDNQFDITIIDVTQSPYNQPPYPPSGDTDSDFCSVTGIAP